MTKTKEKYRKRPEIILKRTCQIENRSKFPKELDRGIRIVTKKAGRKDLSRKKQKEKLRAY